MRNLITDVPGVRVGNAEDMQLGSGATALIFDRPATGSIDLRGGGPGTRETALLDPAQTVEGIDAISAVRRLGIRPRYRLRGTGVAQGTGPRLRRGPVARANRAGGHSV